MESMTITKHQSEITRKSAWTFFAAIFSSVIEEEITPHQARLIVNAIMAALTTAVTAAAPVWITFLALAWLITALRQCKKAGLNNK